MKRCCTCKLEKDESEFGRNKRFLDGLAPNCRKCKNEMNKKYHIKTSERNYRYVIEYLKNHSCIVCGEDDFVVLDFDHREQKEKHLSISDMCWHNATIENIQKEIDKCDILCKNCHYRKTVKQLNHPRTRYI